MKKTPEEMQHDQDEFGAAYDESPAEKKPMSEDEAFGIEADEPPADPKETPAVAVVVAPQGEPATDEPPGEDDPKESQRLKSWEGRLKSWGAEVEPRRVGESLGDWESRLQAAHDAHKSKGDASAESPSEDPQPPAEPEAPPAADDDAYRQAVERFVGDWGDEALADLRVIFQREARQAVGEAEGRWTAQVQSVIGDLDDLRQRQHFEKIYDFHPDFAEVAASQEFADWLPSQGDDAKRIAVSGTAREAINLLNQYKQEVEGKKNLPEADEATDEQLNEAEGVRSSGLRLPDSPVPASDDYEKAWDAA